MLRFYAKQNQNIQSPRHNKTWLKKNYPGRIWNPTSLSSLLFVFFFFFLFFFFLLLFLFLFLFLLLLLLLFFFILLGPLITNPVPLSNAQPLLLPSDFCNQHRFLWPPEQCFWPSLPRPCHTSPTRILKPPHILVMQIWFSLPHSILRKVLPIINQLI